MVSSVTKLIMFTVYTFPLRSLSISFFKKVDASSALNYTVSFQLLSFFFIVSSKAQLVLPYLSHISTFYFIVNKLI